MDGFALRAADARSSLPIRADARIAHAPIALPPASCARIVTGAPIPIGADCVVRIEDTRTDNDLLRIDPGALAHLTPGTFIRRRAENAAKGDTILPAGSLITPAAIGVLAACGQTSVSAHARPLIGILSTGDEVLDAANAAAPEPWQLRDSNGPALAAMLSAHAHPDSPAPRRAPDDPAAIRAALGPLLDSCGAVFITGGVSMGHRDFVPAVLGELGIRTIFHKVPQRPGKPILGALGPRNQLVLALPGNPVSVLVTARRFAIPLLAHIGGLHESQAAPVPAITLANPDGRTIPLWWHRLVRLAPDGRAELTDTRGSGDIISAARSTGFVEIPPDTATPGPWPYYAWT